MSIEHSIGQEGDFWRWTVVASARRMAGLAGTRERAEDMVKALVFFEEAAVKLAAVHPKD